MKLKYLSDLLIIFKAALATLAVSCSAAEVTPAPTSHFACYLTGAGESSSGAIQIMIYDQQTGALESCTCRESIPKYLEIGSSNGLKRVVAIANVPDGELGIDDINDYNSLCSTYVSYCNEDPAAASMSGESTINVHAGAVAAISLTPLLSRIRIRSVKVDFSGHSYSDKTLEDIRAYLINVNGRCPLIPRDRERATEILCQGRFCPGDSVKLQHPEMICSAAVPGCNLYCYPCAASDLCTTRLVIEGRIEGSTYYYPIDVGAPEGVPRGHDLLYNITITRKGSTDPDTPLQAGTVLLSYNVLEWNEYEDEAIYY